MCALGTLLHAPLASAEIVVAVIAPESSETYSQLGSQMRAAAFRAIEDINDSRKIKNGTRPADDQLDLLVLQYADDKCEVDRGITVGNQAASQGLPLIVGHYCSWISTETGKAYANSGLVQIDPFSSMPQASSFPTLVRLTGTFEAQAQAFASYLAANSVEGKEIAVIGDASAPGQALLAAMGPALVAAGIDDPNMPTDDPAMIRLSVDPSQPLPKPGTKEAKAMDAAADGATGHDVVFLAGYPPTVDWLAHRIRSSAASAKIILSDSNLAQDRTPGAADLLFLFPDTPLQFDSDPIRNAAIAKAIEPNGTAGPAAYFTYAALQLWAAGEESAADPWSVYPRMAAQAQNTAIGPIRIDATTGMASGMKFGLFRWNGTLLINACPPQCVP
jgi:branched-chain amino acid transport system substrate-binding protein